MLSSGETVEFAVNVGSQLAHEDHWVAQMLTAEALLADGIEHAVVGEEVDEPLHVHDVALGRIVRAAHNGFCVGCHCHLRVALSKLAYDRSLCITVDQGEQQLTAVPLGHLPTRPVGPALPQRTFRGEGAA